MTAVLFVIFVAAFSYICGFIAGGWIAGMITIILVGLATAWTIHHWKELGGE